MAEKVLMKGNEAIAYAAVHAGCRYFFGYPITPQTEIAAYMAKNLPKAGGVFLQAESEIAAINMVYGAAGAGARVMTSSSSPGISLKQEGISYIAGADLPCVIVNIMRAGPGLGGILPSQSDYFQATKGGGHGDYHMIVLAPSTIQEMVDITVEAFDLADKYRMPVMILGDGILGQMMEPIELNIAKTPEIIAKPWATTGTQCKRKKNIINSLNTNAPELEQWNIARQKRYDEVIANEPRAKTDIEGADVIFSAFGTSARICKTAIELLAEKGIKAGLIRPITLFPFPVYAYKDVKKPIIVVEMNHGQMVEDVRLAAPNVRVGFYGRSGGMVPIPADIVDYTLKFINEGLSEIV
ncbi:MAG: 3-methyl-2-oxobutanoate dehydrogenase subunit VorB [Clostridiales bacterium]|jgi:2-oxoglutarate ferredoxin oxidoreductase subunit alpha|nr:3-methyl-2-oxobutanoate dehydrogenase subunit VorB [Clostridiales bacterium]